MLRIDVDHRGRRQTLCGPRDNPFVGRADFLPEIWAYGLREPGGRFSFDPANGDLWVGDVGQGPFEEVDLVAAAKNYGWNVYEGFEPFSIVPARGETYVPPVFAHPRKFGPSVTGGFVYRANPRSSFYGVCIRRL